MTNHFTFGARSSRAAAVAAVAVVGFGASAANASLSPPTLGTTPPSQGVGLVLAIWNAGSGAGEQVNLGYQYSDITAAGALTPNSLTTPFSSAPNPAGAGSVLQLDFGVIPSFQTLFGTGTGADYMVVAANGTPSTGTSAVYTYSPTNNQTTLGQLVDSSDLNNIVQAIGGQAWGGTAGFTTSTVASDPNNPQGGTMGSGALNTNANFGGAVNSSLNFYSELAATTRRGNPTQTQFGNAQGAGFWFLSSSGDLTWNVLSAVTTAVPLPAALWLFGSGLAGLGAIGRRRVASTSAA